jgi:hypothetical protein
MYLYNSNGLTEAHISPPLLRETSTSRPLPSLIRRLALSAASAPVPDLIAMLRSRSPFPPSSPHPSKPHEAPRLVVASLHVVLTSLSQQCHEGSGGGGLREAFALVAHAESQSPPTSTGPEVYASLLQCCVTTGRSRRAARCTPRDQAQVVLLVERLHWHDAHHLLRPLRRAHRRRAHVRHAPSQ